MHPMKYCSSFLNNHGTKQHHKYKQQHNNNNNLPTLPTSIEVWIHATEKSLANCQGFFWYSNNRWGTFSPLPKTATKTAKRLREKKNRSNRTAEVEIENKFSNKNEYNDKVKNSKNNNDKVRNSNNNNNNTNNENSVNKEV